MFAGIGVNGNRQVNARVQQQQQQGMGFQGQQQMQQTMMANGVRGNMAYPQGMQGHGQAMPMPQANPSGWPQQMRQPNSGVSVRFREQDMVDHWYIANNATRISHTNATTTKPYGGQSDANAGAGRSVSSFPNAWPRDATTKRHSLAAECSSQGPVYAADKPVRPFCLSYVKCNVVE